MGRGRLPDAAQIRAYIENNLLSVQERLPAGRESILHTMIYTYSSKYELLLLKASLVIFSNFSRYGAVSVIGVTISSFIF
jgi:hypothetical protein